MTDREQLANWRIRRGRQVLWIGVGLLAIGGWAGQAWAGEPGFYAGGRFHRLLVSPDESVVELPEGSSFVEAALALRMNGDAVLEEVGWGERGGRLAILRRAAGVVEGQTRLRAMPGMGAALPVYRFQPDGPRILSSGNIVVRLRADVSAAERAAMFDSYQVDEVQAVEGLANTFVVRPRGDAGAYELDTANALHRDVRTVYAHPDLRFPVVTRQLNGETEVGPDTFSAQQWYLTAINIADAFRRSTGAGVIIGQLDDSCDLEHEDLVANYTGMSHNTADNAQSATAALPTAAGNRHGTSTMGLMCAAQFNNAGIIGVAPDARFTASRGLESFITTSQIASAYTYARNADVDVHNNSWGFGSGTPNPPVIEDAIRTAFSEGRGGRGMILCFASGSGLGMDPADPVAQEVEGDDELSTLPTVIGVGASNALDEVAVYSNFGDEIDVLAPSNDLLAGGAALPAILTTDNTDASFPFEPGYNNNGFSDDDSVNLANPQYTNNFGGTSASAALVSGIAGLILSLEPDYTAFQVRNIIEHTCDQINSAEAGYDGVTSRSLRYGYGRVNAGAAVEATFDGFYWPERVADVTVDLATGTIHWAINDDLRQVGQAVFGVPTISVLVVESDGPFDWKPTDGAVYSVGQTVLPGVTVVANLLAEQYSFAAGAATKYFGIYSVAQTDIRGLTYGFGVKVTSDGTVLDSGRTLDSDIIDIPPGRPSVTIQVSPLSGDSPLNVQFEANAQSTSAIASYLWDFGDGTTSSNRVTSHTYNVLSGTQRFFVTMTVTDANGAVGNAAVAIDVSAPGGGGDGGGGGSVSIRISSPSSPDSDISSGTAPLSVILNAEVSGLASPSQNLTVFWDLGDGNIASSLSVVHTYQNPGSTVARYPVSVTVTDPTLQNPLNATRFLDVLPASTTSPSPTATSEPNGDGDGGVLCGMGMMTAFWSLSLLLVLRRLTR